jgi:hypothetical protein
MTIEEDHLADVEVFGIIESVAVETFNQGSTAIIPEEENTRGCYDCHPLLLGMDGQDTHLCRSVDIQVEELFCPAGHINCL